MYLIKGHEWVPVRSLWDYSSELSTVLIWLQFGILCSTSPFSCHLVPIKEYRVLFARSKLWNILMDVLQDVHHFLTTSLTLCQHTKGHLLLKWERYTSQQSMVIQSVPVYYRYAFLHNYSYNVKLTISDCLDIVSEYSWAMCSGTTGLRHLNQWR